MHKEAMQQMGVLLNRYTNDRANVLDVGSYDVNGNYRDMVESRGWKYTGMDIVPGKNVDVVSPELYNFPFEDNSFDIVLSGSVMEHVFEPQLWLNELARLLRPGGLLAVITHTSWPYHPHPVDTFRYMPDGVNYMLNKTGRLERFDISMYCSTDISFTAWKVQHG